MEPGDLVKLQAVTADLFGSPGQIRVWFVEADQSGWVNVDQPGIFVNYTQRMSMADEVGCVVFLAELAKTVIVKAKWVVPHHSRSVSVENSL